MRRFARFLLFGALLLSSAAWAGLQGREVDYHAAGTALKGYLVYDDAISGPRPGVLVVHEWWGLNRYARKRAEMLARAGYVALAVDMYGAGRQARHPKEAAEFAGRVINDLPLAKARFLAAMEVLRRHPVTDGARLAAIGYCFGGGVVLEMARAGLDLDAVVSFHGSLATAHPARRGRIKARILVFNGGADPFVPAEQVAGFKAEMEQAGADYRFIEYPGVKHSFTNPEANMLADRFKLPLAYDRKADLASWREMLEFLAETFKGGAATGRR